MILSTNESTVAKNKLIFVIDPWIDKNAVRDAAKMGVPVVALCDTNNDSLNVDLCIPCNNKGKKSLGLIFFIMAREYLNSRKKKFDSKVEEFIEE